MNFPCFSSLLETENSHPKRRNSAVKPTVGYSSCEVDSNMNGRRLPAALVIRTHSERGQQHPVSGDACVSYLCLESQGPAKLQQTELPFHLCIIILFHRGHGRNGCRCSVLDRMCCDYIRTGSECSFTRATEGRVETMRFMSCDPCVSCCSVYGLWALPGAGS